MNSHNFGSESYRFNQEIKHHFSHMEHMAFESQPSHNHIKHLKHQSRASKVGWGSAKLLLGVSIFLLTPPANPLWLASFKAIGEGFEDLRDTL